MGYLPHGPLDAIAGTIGERLQCFLHDLATHHWIPTQSASSPLRLAVERYDDGNEGSFVVDTSSEKEIALFKIDFETELELLRQHYDRVEVIFGVCSSHRNSVG